MFSGLKADSAANNQGYIMESKLKELASWLNSNGLKRDSLLVSDMLSKFSKLEEEVALETEDNSSGQYWDFHISNVPNGWSASVFAAKDLMSRGNNRVKMYKPALRALSVVASKRPGGRAVRLTNQVDSSKNGGYRDKTFNSSVGGARNSQHVDGKAFDIHVADYTEEERLLLLQALVDAGFAGFGHGKNVIHADFGPRRTWTYAGYRKPSEDAYRSGSNSVVEKQEESPRARRVERREDRRSRRRKSRGCSPPFDETLMADIKFGKTLSIGARGPEVGYMQTLLENNGVSLPRFGIDCIFGPETKGALKEFQNRNNLEDSGILNNSLLSLLEDGPQISGVPDQLEPLVEGSEQASDRQATVHDMDKMFKDWSSIGIHTGRGSNFHRIGAGKNNYRSAIPPQSADFFRYLKEKYGIKNIINLKSDGGEGELVRAVKGLKYIPIPLGSRPPNSSDWEQIKALLDSGDTLIHCRHGADRTGATIAKWKIERDIMEPGPAFEEALTYGFKKDTHPGYPEKLKRCHKMPEETDEQRAKKQKCIDDVPDPNKKLRRWVFS